MGLGIALIILGGWVALFLLGGYLQTFTKNPIVEPQSWGQLGQRERDHKRAEFKIRMRRWRPRLLLGIAGGLVCAAVGIVLVATQ